MAFRKWAKGFGKKTGKTVFGGLSDTASNILSTPLQAGAEIFEGDFSDALGELAEGAYVGAGGAYLDHGLENFVLDPARSLFSGGKSRSAQMMEEDMPEDPYAPERRRRGYGSTFGGSRVASLLDSY